jgi:Cu+-exporting ATPase
VLFRNAEALEVLETITTLVVDKTGTLTEGKPRLVTIAPSAPLDESTLLRLIASLESVSEHPLAGAIVAGCARAEDWAVTSAAVRVDDRGRRQWTGGRRSVAVGQSAIPGNLGVDSGVFSSPADELRLAGQTVMFVVIDGRASGLIGVADPVKPTTHDAIDALHRERVKVVMLTGDNRTTAEAVAQAVGIDAIEADVLPDQKAAVVKQLQQRGERVAMARGRHQRRTGARTG